VETASDVGLTACRTRISRREPAWGEPLHRHLACRLGWQATLDATLDSHLSSSRVGVSTTLTPACTHGDVDEFQAVVSALDLLARSGDVRIDFRHVDASDDKRIVDIVRFTKLC
jgi:hypothetical protein